MANKFEIILSSYTIEELAEASAWYENEVDGLGNDFLSFVNICFDLIANNPALFPLITKGIHRALVKKYPYAVYFELWQGKIYVYGVVHTKRHPDTWKNKRKPERQ